MDRKERKGQIEFNTIVYWIIGTLAVVFGIIEIIYLNGKGVSFFDAIKNLFHPIG